jgi:hypothetical protein
LANESEAMTMEAEIQVRIYELEEETFQNTAFQVYIIFLFLSVYGVSTWITVYLGLPI